MAGAAVIVALQQLKGLFGIDHFTNKMQLIPVLSSVFHHRDEVEYNFMEFGIKRSIRIPFFKLRPHWVIVLFDTMSSLQYSDIS